MHLSLGILNEWMGILPNASEHGYLIDHMLEACHWFMAALFVGWTSYFFYCIFRFHRSRHPKASYHGVKSKASAHIEFSVVLVEAVLLLGFALPLWARRVTEFPSPDDKSVLRIRAIGEQFFWTFHYSGPDGKFGRVDAKFVTANNPLGIDPSDPDGKDDYYSKELHVMNYRPTVIEVTSKDVIHSLSLEAMRMDQDAIPGSRIPMWFKPIVAGHYEIVCAQLCGAGHSGMKADMFVEDQATFEGWVKDTLALQHPELATPAAAPAVPAAGAGSTAPAVEKK
jgi:cytochrome c oxidase subunit II